MSFAAQVGLASLIVFGALPLEARAEEPEARPEPAAKTTVPPERRALAGTAAIFPGALVHGAGHYVLGEQKTAARLLLAEGVGLGMILGGGTGLFLTGASRYTVAPFAALSIFGVGVFSTAFLADLYGVTATDQAAAGTRRGLGPGWFESELGYRYVQTPVFAYRDFTEQRLTFWFGRTRAEASSLTSFGGDNARYRGEIAQRILGPGARETERFEDRLDVEVAGTHHRYAPERFTRTTAELSLQGRWDLAHIGATLSGAFVEGGLGYAYNTTAFDFSSVEVESDQDDLLLANMGFGILLRGASAPGSEVAVFYDHRHDDLAAGFVMPGLGSGVAGHFGLRARLFLDMNFGIAAEALAGSAIVAGGSLVFREGAPR